MSDIPEPTVEEQIVDALPANTKDVVSGAPNMRGVTLLRCGRRFPRTRAAALGCRP